MRAVSIYRSIIEVCIIAFCLLITANIRALYADAAVRVINTTSGGTVTVTAKNISDDQPVGDGIIRWDSVTIGQTKWKIANQYLEVTFQDLPASWGIQIYTNNKDAGAVPQYTGTGDPAGLVRVTNPVVAIPMAWRITDQTIPIGDLVDPVERTESRGFEDYLWHFIKDKNTPDNPTTPEDETFVNGEEYVTLWNQAGIAWNEGGRAGNPKKGYIYLAAKFNAADIQTEYKTSMLTLEAYYGIFPFPIYLYKNGSVLEDHFAPSGWMNYLADSPHIIVDAQATEVTPHSEPYSFKLEWNGGLGAEGVWGGVMWLEPSDIWDWVDEGNDPEDHTHNGYDLRGADYLSFWARTDADNVGLRIKVWFGNDWDSSGYTTNSGWPFGWVLPALTETWQEYIILFPGSDMSNITGGFAVVFDEFRDPDPDGCPIYLDDIKFDRF